MNKTILKMIRDDSPNWLKKWSAPLLRRALIKNKHFSNRFNFLQKAENLNQVDLKKYQFEKTKDILIYANKYVPYYNRLFKEISFNPETMQDIQEIKQIPILTKSIINDNFHDLISTIKVKGGHYNATTGGSTGQPLDFLLDYNSIYKENAFVYHYRSKVGYTFKDKIASFRGGVYINTFWKSHPMYNDILLSPYKLNSEKITDYYNILKKYSPQWLNGYSSTIYYFAKLLSSNNIHWNINLKGIFFCSENVDPEQRFFIEQFFKVKSYTFYGHSERAVIANEVSPFSYQFDPFYGYTELIKNEHGDLNIVATGFLSQSMPFIRYRTDDICKPITDNTYSIVGRRNVNDFLIGKNNEKLYISSFCYLNEAIKEITNYQFIQTKTGETELNIIPTQKFDSANLPVINQNVNKRMKGVIDIKVKVVDKLELTSSGKGRLILNKIK